MIVATGRCYWRLMSGGQGGSSHPAEHRTPRQQNRLVSVVRRLRHSGRDQEAASKGSGTLKSAGRLDKAERASGGTPCTWGNLQLITTNVLAGRARPGPPPRSRSAITKAAQTGCRRWSLRLGGQPARGRGTAGCPPPSSARLGQLRASPYPVSVASIQELCKLLFQKLFV